MDIIQTNTSTITNAMLNTTATGKDSCTALDVVFIIDTSGSMEDEAQSLSASFNAALEEVQKKCPSELRFNFFGIQGTWPSTKFDKSLSDYLTARGIDGKNLQARPVDSVVGKGAQEDVARAVIDCCTYYDWLPGACHAIFVLGDEGLEGGGCELTKAAKEKNNEAIACAQKHLIKVYTYQGTPNDKDPDSCRTLKDKDALTKEYRRLADETGGRAYIYTTGIADFNLVLQEILCDSLNPPDHKFPDDSAQCSHVCDQLSAIITTIQMLAIAINKTIDSCCHITGKGTLGDQSKEAGNCDCRGKKH